MVYRFSIYNATDNADDNAHNRRKSCEMKDNFETESNVIRTSGDETAYYEELWEWMNSYLSANHIP